MSTHSALNWTPLRCLNSNAFWRLEEIPQETRLSAEDQRAEDIFVTTHTRLPGGRYEVQLPFKSDEETEF